MKTIGIDISKLTFDLWSEDLGHMKFDNCKQGFQAFLELLSTDDYCVMEATGSYHFQLANALYEAGVNVSVVNPLVVKRFIQMKRQKHKNDQIDAKMIALFAAEQGPELWEPEPEFIVKAKLTLGLIQLYTKQQTQLKNKLKTLQSGGVESGSLILSIKRHLKAVQKELKSLDNQLETLVEENVPNSLTKIKSIPGIGKKTAVLLVVFTNNFRDFSNAKQVSAFVGLSPTERNSGTSIRGRSYISKKGNPMIRYHLFMCSFSASIHNPQCKALYERVVGKGKSKKLALVAVCNKLLKQAYGVSKNDLIYDVNYRSKKAA